MFGKERIKEWDMWSRLTNAKLLASVVMSVALIAAMACGSAEEATPAAAPAVVAPTAAPAAPAAAPAAEEAEEAPAAAAEEAPAAAAEEAPAAAVAGTTCYIKGDLITDCPELSPHTYQPALVAKGDYGTFAYEGPAPTKYYESPMSHVLVKQGLIPPVEDRLPPNPRIFNPPHSIGDYGGVWRQTVHGIRWLFVMADSVAMVRDINGVDYQPHGVGESASVSDDGRVWTFKFREGSKYHDGTPVVIEDFRFGFTDVTLNKTLFPTVESTYRDDITGNDLTWAAVDENTWTFTYDNPKFTILEGPTYDRGQCESTYTHCWFAPNEYLKQFHEDYADATALQAMIDAGDFDNWSQFWGEKVSFETNHLVTGENFLGGHPCMRAWCLTVSTENYIEMTRNHYWPEVDPEGNQLPYADGHAAFGNETREIGVFRSMNGETDIVSNIFALSELPLYRSNQEKGDYRIYHWPSASGSDSNMSVNQDYNLDAEIGMWLRQKDFRRAMSMGMDRDEINEVLFLGLGTPQNFTPHPSTPMYPGDEWPTFEATLDTAKAIELLDGLGLVDTDGDGYRDRSDGGGKLKLEFMVPVPGQWTVPTFEVVELLKSHWGDMGIWTGYNSSDDWGSKLTGNEEYLGVWEAPYQANPWGVFWTAIFPISKNSKMAPATGEFIDSKGERGVGPGVDATMLPLAAADSFPSDHSGQMQALIDLWAEGLQYPTYHPERIRLGKETFIKTAQEKFNIGTVGFSGSFRGIALNRNNFVNVPETNARDTWGFQPQIYSFIGGQDNLHNDRRFDD
jgi:peptide/nickel transport system substrate-binding protein